MSLRKGWLACFTLGAFLASTADATADPVLVTSGTIVVSGAQDLESRGFLRTVSVDLSTGTFRVSAVEPDGPTQNYLAPRLENVADVTGAAGLPDLVRLEAEFAIDTTPGPAPTPFMLTGTLQFLQLFTGNHLLTTDVRGTGLATWRFVSSPSGAPVVSEVTYDFTPVPEPVTLMLVGLGLGGIAAERRVRRPFRHPA